MKDEVEDSFEYPLDRYLSEHFTIGDTGRSEREKIQNWLRSLSMDDREPMDNQTKGISSVAALPPPRQVINQSAEYQVIEKAAKLLKKVEQHWKKSLFQNRLQFSPVSDSINSSESENYIEKLAAIKFKDASFRSRPILAGDAGQRYTRESMEQNLKMSYDVFSNYFDIMGPRNVVRTENQTANAKIEKTAPTKCARCLSKEKMQEEKAALALPKQQYALKQSTYGQRSISRQGRFGLQVSPRSNESLQTGRTYASTYSSPRVKANPNSAKIRASSSNPDLRNISFKSSRYQNTPRSGSKFCGTDLVISRDRVDPECAFTSCIQNNVSVVNIKSNSQETDIPQVNPRKMASAPDKMIIIQHLPQVDIRPELSKHSGPVISIDAEVAAEEQKDLKHSNIGVFSYVHKNKPKFHQDELKNLSNFNQYKRLTENRYSEEESFAAQLELRSVAENFIFRLKKNDNPSGLILLTTLLRLMDEINELIDERLCGNDSAPQTDPNLPPRLEMVSDLLSDELKTWGAQPPSHYQSLNNIIQHLILDIHFAKHGDYPQPQVSELSNTATKQIAPAKKSSILKTRKTKSSYGSVNRRHISLSANANYDRERGEMTYRSTQSEEMSLSDKLLNQNALKVLRLEKAYQINHRVKVFKKQEDEMRLKEVELNKMERNNSLDETVEDTDKIYNTDESNKQQSGSSGNYSHPVVAIISASQSGSEHGDDYDKTISDEASDAQDKSIEENIQDQDNANESKEFVQQDNEDEEEKEIATEQQDQSTDKPLSEVEDEDVGEEIASNSSHKDEGGEKNEASDYDEDFETEITENPTQSATVSTNENKEKARKLSSCQPVFVNETCQTDFKLSSDLDSDPSKGKKSDSLEVDRGHASESLLPSNKNKEPLEKTNLIDVDSVLKDGNGVKKGITFVDPLALPSSHLWNFSKSKIFDKSILRQSLMNRNENQSLENEPDTKDNFVKVHVRDEQGEIILSYAGSKPNSDTKSLPAEPEVKTTDRTESKSDLKEKHNIDTYIDTERKILENLTSNLLKELFDDKLDKILSKFTDRNTFKQDKLTDFDRPSTSGINIKEQWTQTNNEQKTFKMVSRELQCEIDRSGNEMDYLLKSPSFKLKLDDKLIAGSDSALAREETDALNSNGIADNCSNLNEVKELNRCSPDLKLLISLVDELDSSDIEHCEASLQQFSGGEQNTTDPVINTNIRMHHFNSDEFLLYPRLNPQPSDIKDLQYTKDEVINKTTANSQKSDVESNKNFDNLQKISFKSVATECDLRVIEKLNPDPVDLLAASINTLSTQTEFPRSMPVSFPENLVDFIEISCSPSSSSRSESQKPKDESIIPQSPGSESKDIYKPGDQTNISPGTLRDITNIQNLHENQNYFSNCEVSSTKSEPSDLLSVVQREINLPKLFSHRSSNIDLIRKDSGTAVQQSDEISSTSDETDPSSHCTSLSSRSPLTGSILKVLQTSSARPTALSSSSESTTDEERFFAMHQPLSDDDALGDLEQLMDYLKSSKCSTSSVRMRRCPRHKKQ